MEPVEEIVEGVASMASPWMPWAEAAAALLIGARVAWWLAKISGKGSAKAFRGLASLLKRPPAPPEPAVPLSPSAQAILNSMTNDPQEWSWSPDWNNWIFHVGSKVCVEFDGEHLKKLNVGEGGEFHPGAVLIKFNGNDRKAIDKVSRPLRDEFAAKHEDEKHEKAAALFAPKQAEPAQPLSDQPVREWIKGKGIVPVIEGSSGEGNTYVYEVPAMFSGCHRVVSRSEPILGSSAKRVVTRYCTKNPVYSPKPPQGGSCTAPPVAQVVGRADRDESGSRGIPVVDCNGKVVAYANGYKGAATGKKIRLSAWGEPYPLSTFVPEGYALVMTGESSFRYQQVADGGGYYLCSENSPIKYYPNQSSGMWETKPAASVEPVGQGLIRVSGTESVSQQSAVNPELEKAKKNLADADAAKEVLEKRIKELTDEMAKKIAEAEARVKAADPVGIFNPYTSGYVPKFPDSFHCISTKITTTETKPAEGKPAEKKDELKPKGYRKGGNWESKFVELDSSLGFSDECTAGCAGECKRLCEKHGIPFKGKVQ